MLTKVIENMHDWKMKRSYKEEKIVNIYISITAGWQYQTKKKREEIVNIDNVEYWMGAWLQDGDIKQRRRERRLLILIIWNTVRLWTMEHKDILSGGCKACWPDHPSKAVLSKGRNRGWRQLMISVICPYVEVLFRYSKCE